MDAFTPAPEPDDHRPGRRGRPDDRAELTLTPAGEPNDEVLRTLIAAINEAVALARANRPTPALRPKAWRTDPDAPPTPVAEAVARAEDAIRDIAADPATRRRAEELRERSHQPDTRGEADSVARRALSELNRIVAGLVGDGVVPVARAVTAAEVLVAEPERS